MPGLLRGVARTAVIAGTATHVSNNVSRRQTSRWAEKEQAQYPPGAAGVRRAAPGRGRARPADRAAQGAGRAEGTGHPDRGGVRGPEGPDPGRLSTGRLNRERTRGVDGPRGGRRHRKGGLQPGRTTPGQAAAPATVSTVRRNVINDRGRPGDTWSGRSAAAALTAPGPSVDARPSAGTVQWLDVEVGRPGRAWCGPVPDGPGPGGDERRDLAAGRRLRHHSHHHPDGDRALRPGDGRPDAHRRQAGRPLGPAPRVLDRTRDLRLGVCSDSRVVERPFAVVRLVDPRRDRSGARHAGPGRPGRGQLRGEGPRDRVRRARRRRRGRHRRGPDPRRLGHDRGELANRVRG